MTKELDGLATAICNPAQGANLPRARSSYFEAMIRQILKEMGEDPDRQGLKETPARVWKAWKHITAGYDQKVEDVLTVFEEQDYNQFVFKGSIPFYSTCEHHMLPFFGMAHVGYIPNGKIIGISKLTRIVDIFARRLQVQERITNQVADALINSLDAKGVGVVLQCRHLCVEARGVEKIGTITQTVALRGDCLNEPDCRAEFMTLVKLTSDGVKGL